jgi:hypothetical protein
MPCIEQALCTLLKTFGAVTAIVGTGADARIRPFRLDQGDIDDNGGVRDSIVIRPVHEDHLNDLSGVGGLVKSRIQVIAISEVPINARTLAEAVRVNGTDPGTGLAGYDGAPDSVTIQSAMLDAKDFAEAPYDDDSDRSFFAVISNYIVEYNETT